MNKIRLTLYDDAAGIIDEVDLDPEEGFSWDIEGWSVSKIFIRRVESFFPDDDPGDAPDRPGLPDQW